MFSFDVFSCFVSLTVFEDSLSGAVKVLLLVVADEFELLISFQISSSDRNLVRLNSFGMIYLDFLTLIFRPFPP